MNIQVLHTPKVTSSDNDIFQLIDAVLPAIQDGTVIALAAKIVSVCEGRAILQKDADKDALIEQEADWYLPRSSNKYDVCFSITRSILIPSAGIDESNADDHYVLWPKDPQESANQIRSYIMEKYNLSQLGVVITDSTTRPLQWGTTGIAIAYSGFKPLRDYTGTADIFGRTMQFQKNNIANGLAAAAVVMMGEGSEQTPIAVITDVPFVDFQEHGPTAAELESLKIGLEDDVYAPLLTAVEWKKGRGGKSSQ